MAVKITQIAKDMNMKSKEIADFLKSIKLEKKSGDQLDTDEWSLFLDCLTKENQIKNIDDYLSGKATINVVRSEPVKKQAEKEDAPQKEAPAAQPIEAKKEEKKEEKKEASSMKVAPASAEKEAKNAEQAPIKKAEEKPVQKQEVKAETPVQEKKPQAAPQQNSKKKEKERKQRQSFKTIIPNMPISSDAPTEIVVPKNKTRVVDTRTTTVDLSRYDDRLDHIAAGKADLRGGHQKLKKQNKIQEENKSES